MEVIKLERLLNCSEKIIMLFKQFCQAPNLKKLRVDMNGLNPLPILPAFFESQNTILKLNLTNLSASDGLRFFDNLKDNTSIRELKVQFQRLSFNA